MKGFVLGVILTSVCFLAWPRVQPAFAKKEDPVTLELRSYIAKNFADPDAELTAVSEPVEFNGKTWRFITLRLVNAMGGKVFASYFVVYELGAPMKFIRDNAYAELPGATKEESEAFSKAFANVKTVDVRTKKAAH